jgi:hypothetical protein
MTTAKQVAAAAESAGAEVRVRHVAETHDSESLAYNPAWTANYQANKGQIPPGVGRCRIRPLVTGEIDASAKTRRSGKR